MPPKGLRHSGDWLFPRAIRVAGWRHKWDLLIRKGLCSMKRFPRWLKLLKSLVKFCRNHSLMGTLCKKLDYVGKSGLADLLRQLRCPSFLHWRWSALSGVCDAVNTCVNSFISNFSPDWFENTRDRALTDDIVALCKCPDFLRMLSFVTWYANWLTPILEWIGGCRCHQPDDPLAQSCNMKGRRLPEARN